MGDAAGRLGDQPANFLDQRQMFAFVPRPAANPLISIKDQETHVALGHEISGGKRRRTVMWIVQRHTIVDTGLLSQAAFISIEPKRYRNRTIGPPQRIP